MEDNKEFDIGRSDNKSGKGMGWYVVHTYSGYENKVKVSIENAIENRHLENEILEVRVPVREETDIKNGAKKTVSRKMLPGYVLIHMDADNNDAWFVVRNTRGVTGFVGPGSKPVPLSEEEMAALDFNTTHEKLSLDVSEGDTVMLLMPGKTEWVLLRRLMQVSRQLLLILRSSVERLLLNSVSQKLKKCNNWTYVHRLILFI